MAAILELRKLNVFIGKLILSMFAAVVLLIE